MPKKSTAKTVSKATKSKTKTGGAKATKKAKTAKAKTTKAKTGGGKKAKATKKATKSKAKTGGSKETSSATARKTRFFKVVVDGGDAYGRFSGTKPKQAANKGLTSILRKMGKNKKSASEKIHFSIVECTRGSKRKEYKYIGNRKKLDNPVTVSIKGKEVVYNYMNTVKKDKSSK